MGPDMKTGAEIIVGSLISHGVTTLFGYPGATVLPLYDELYSSPLRHILVRHEQAAAHAADGFARAGGRPGICLATSGPGACNLITGIATAYMDSSPVIAITGQVPTHLLGKDAFQEADITGMTMPVTKHSYLVKHVGDLESVMREAFHLAGTGRKGPVLIDIPKDVSTGRAVWSDCETPVAIPGYRPIEKGSRHQIEKIRDLIRHAESPVIYAGGGVTASGASGELIRFAERMMIPVTTTLMGLGCIPGDHPLNLGMLGMHGTVQANYAISGCDLLIALGARFDDRVTGGTMAFAPHAQVIHIDIDPAEIGKNRSVDVPVVGDVRTVLNDLFRGLVRERDNAAWRQKIAGWRNQFPEQQTDDGALHPREIIWDLSRIVGNRAIIVTDVGQHQMWAAQQFCFRYPRQLITSGGLGTMGFGLPAAMGAHFACPEKDVYVISGDGSIQMSIQELATIRQYNIPLKILIMNNMYLGMVRQWQELFYDRRYAFTELPSLDFKRIASAYGIDGITVELHEDMLPALKTATETEGPFVIDFRISREENVFPMVPSGSALHEMVHGAGPQWSGNPDEAL